MSRSKLLKGAKDKQKRRGDKESPWNMPLFISISQDVRVPIACFRSNVVFQFFMFTSINFIISGDTLQSSNVLIIQLCGTLSKAFL